MLQPHFNNEVNCHLFLLRRSSTDICATIINNNNSPHVVGSFEATDVGITQLRELQRYSKGLNRFWYLPEATFHHDGLLLDHRLILPDPTLLLFQNASLLPKHSGLNRPIVHPYFSLDLACEDECISQLCLEHPDTIKYYVVHENTLTYQFNFFCGGQFWRIFFKVSAKLYRQEQSQWPLLASFFMELWVI